MHDIAGLTSTPHVYLTAWRHHHHHIYYNLPCSTGSWATMCVVNTLLHSHIHEILPGKRHFCHTPGSELLLAHTRHLLLPSIQWTQRTTYLHNLTCSLYTHCNSECGGSELLWYDETAYCMMLKPTNRIMVFALLECYTTHSGSYWLTFQNSLLVPSSRNEQCKKNAGQHQYLQ